MKKALSKLLEQALVPVAGEHAGRLRHAGLEQARDARNGHYASSAAMQLAGRLRRPPADIAEEIAAGLSQHSLIGRVETAGPGFINIWLDPEALQAELDRIVADGEAYGSCDLGAGRKVLVEFVSANPTGPLHVGHGRLAAVGDCLARLLEATGHEVWREYYVNDAGRQLAVLGLSVWLRMVQRENGGVRFPDGAYRGEYILDLARRMAGELPEAAEAARKGMEWPKDKPPDGKDADRYVDALVNAARETLGDQLFADIGRLAGEWVLDDIRDDLNQFGVQFDHWQSERELVTGGEIDACLEKLAGVTYRRDGALWFPAEKYGDEKDRVVVRADGRSTYFASDIAYHYGKRKRGADVLLDVLGADHHGYVGRVRAGLEALGEPPSSLEIRLVQFVALYRGGERVAMSTRGGEFETLRNLREEVGVDAARFFYVSRAGEQHLDFDLDLARKQSSDNPVYYVQYAHARVASLFEKMQARGMDFSPDEGSEHAGLLEHPREIDLMLALARLPETVEQAAVQRAPQVLAHYLIGLAQAFHGWYNHCKVLDAESGLRGARLLLAQASGQVLRNGLRLLGVSAPRSM
ncbi:MAG: arginine--tRNA ligase [Gammaproteobacteria bacterium]|nr:arginine--tRNA ligase [Gammaproteobacteria bacterium]MYD01470.1 arginine--tRNA ligase [Gammaproteobacteria bacterium]MYI26162.1 arginine--tRNA ligase [Gammaproteobacteria bacterium]